MSKDLGRHLPAQLHCDSSAAIGIAGRRGAGRVRHFEVSIMWLQRHITNRVLGFFKGRGDENVADIGTKHTDQRTLRRALANLGYISLE